MVALSSATLAPTWPAPLTAAGLRPSASGARTAATRGTRSTRRSPRSTAATWRGCAWPGPTTRATRDPTAARRSSATRSWSTACSTRPRPASRRSRSTPRPAASSGASTPSPPARAPAGSGSTAVSSSGARAPSGASSTAPARRCSRSTRARGRLVRGFGRGGRVDLGEGLGRDLGGAYVLATTPGVVYRDLLILGSARRRGPGPSAPGHVRAFDVRTGAVRWTFHTIPQPGRVRLRHVASRRLEDRGRRELLERAQPRPGARDRLRAHRLAGVRLLGRRPPGRQPLRQLRSLALGAATGERVWHYQLVRHDLWDRDLPAVAGARRRAAGRADDRRRRAGHEVRARVRVRPRRASRCSRSRSGPCRRSDLLGRAGLDDAAPARRPPAFARQAFAEADATDISPASRAAVLERLRQVRSGGQFVPPSTQGTIIFPGFDGGAEWGGSAFDPRDAPALRQRQRDALDPRDARGRRRPASCPWARASTRSTAPSATAPTRQGAPQAQSPAARPGLETRTGRGRGRSPSSRRARASCPPSRSSRPPSGRGRVLRPRRARARRTRTARRRGPGGPTRTSATTASSTPRATPR